MRGVVVRGKAELRDAACELNAPVLAASRILVYSATAIVDGPLPGKAFVRLVREHQARLLIINIPMFPSPRLRGELSGSGLGSSRPRTAASPQGRAKAPGNRFPRSCRSVCFSSDGAGLDV
jgi:hypothetical protein